MIIVNIELCVHWHLPNQLHVEIFQQWSHLRIYILTMNKIQELNQHSKNSRVWRQLVICTILSMLWAHQVQIFPVPITNLIRLVMAKDNISQTNLGIIHIKLTFNKLQINLTHQMQCTEGQGISVVDQNLTFPSWFQQIFMLKSLVEFS